MYNRNQQTDKPETTFIASAAEALRNLADTEIKLPRLLADDPEHPVLTGPYDTQELQVIGSEPITVTVSRLATDGHEQQLAAALEELAELAKQAPGNLGAAVFAPGSPIGPWQLIARFSDATTLRRWEESETRLAALDKIDHMVEDTAVAATSSPEAFFAAQAATRSSGQLRRIVTDTAWSLPASFLVVSLVAVPLGSSPLLLRLAITGLLASGISAFLIRPIRTHLARQRDRRAPLR